jgi:hypothetical protein
MPIEFKKNRAIFREEVSVEEAEAPLEWLQTRSAAKADLSACSHMDTANLQSARFGMVSARRIGLIAMREPRS